MRSTAPTPTRRRRLLRAAGAVAASTVAASGAVLVAHRRSPRPAATVIGTVFNRHGRSAADHLERGAPEVTVVPEVRYRRGDPDALLDLYLPVDRPSGGSSAGAPPEVVPVVVWIHGGGWLAGSRAFYAGYFRRLAAAGIAVAAVGYSLAPRHRYPTALHQVAAAVAHVAANAPRWGIERPVLVVAGDSAGANLAAQFAAASTNPDYADLVGLAPLPDRLRGAILHCGIYDVTTLATSTPRRVWRWGAGQLLRSYLGEGSAAPSGEVEQLSVLRHVTASFPPTLITGGGADPLTATQAVPMADRLDALGVPVARFLYEADHPGRLPHEFQFDLSRPESVVVLEATVAFVDRAAQAAGAGAEPAGRRSGAPR